MSAMRPLCASRTKVMTGRDAVWFAAEALPPRVPDVSGVGQLFGAPYTVRPAQYSGQILR